MAQPRTLALRVILGLLTFHGENYPPAAQLAWIAFHLRFDQTRCTTPESTIWRFHANDAGQSSNRHGIAAIVHPCLQALP